MTDNGYIYYWWLVGHHIQLLSQIDNVRWKYDVLPFLSSLALT